MYEQSIESMRGSLRALLYKRIMGPRSLLPEMETQVDGVIKKLYGMLGFISWGIEYESESRVATL